MVYRVLADGVMVTHFAFIVFVAAGSLLAIRWRWLVWFHVPALVWAAVSVTIGATCPLTPMEKWLRRMAGGEGYDGGFVDRYIEDVVYPDEYTGVLRAVAVVTIAAGYVALGASGASRRRGRNTWTSGPIASANATVPTPTDPPSAQPETSAASSIAVRAARIDHPKRSCSPIINPSRGPGPSPEPM
jgi:hypothetical protein